MCVTDPHQLLPAAGATNSVARRDDGTLFHVESAWRSNWSSSNLLVKQLSSAQLLADWCRNSIVLTCHSFLFDPAQSSRGCESVRLISVVDQLTLRWTDTYNVFTKRLNSITKSEAFSSSLKFISTSLLQVLLSDKLDNGPHAGSCCHIWVLERMTGCLELFWYLSPRNACRHSALLSEQEASQMR